MLNFFRAMETLDISVGPEGVLGLVCPLGDNGGPLQAVLEQAAHRWGMATFQPGLLQNLEFCDQMLQLLDHHSMPDDLRCDVYGSYIGPGPGGLQAFFWLLQRDHLDRALVRDYLNCLQCGPARSGALSEDQFLPLLKTLIEHWRGENEELVWHGLTQVLNSNAISARSRVAGLRLALSYDGIPPDRHTGLAHWACRNDHNHPDLPAANPELHKCGFLECVRLGEPPLQTLQEALHQLEEGSEVAESAGQAVLELLHNYPGEIPGPTQQAALLSLKESRLDGLRRKAFQLLEKSQGQEWIHAGLRDRDAAVRSWAMQRASQQRKQSASA